MDGQVVGRWTMVYDEGFEMVINGTSYFAFSKYSYEGNSQPKDDDDEKSDGYKSQCHSTFMGWYHTVSNTHGCFYANKLGPIPPS